MKSASTEIPCQLRVVHWGSRYLKHGACRVSVVLRFTPTACLKCFPLVREQASRHQLTIPGGGSWRPQQILQRTHNLWISVWPSVTSYSWWPYTMDGTVNMADSGSCPSQKIKHILGLFNLNHVALWHLNSKLDKVQKDWIIQLLWIVAKWHSKYHHHNPCVQCTHHHLFPTSPILLFSALPILFAPIPGSIRPIHVKSS